MNSPTDPSVPKFNVQCTDPLCDGTQFAQYLSVCHMHPDDVLESRSVLRVRVARTDPEETEVRVWQFAFQAEVWAPGAGWLQVALDMTGCTGDEDSAREKMIAHFRRVLSDAVFVVTGGIHAPIHEVSAIVKEELAKLVSE